jgi:hypothetical protein
MAIVLSAGIELGALNAGASSWIPFFPWIHCAFIVGSIVLLLAGEGQMFQILGVFLVGCLATLAFSLAPAYETYPDIRVLVAVWFASWGALAIIHKDQILPSTHIMDYFRLWTITRSTDTPPPPAAT